MSGNTPSCHVCGRTEPPLAAVRAMDSTWRSNVFAATGVLHDPGSVLCKPCADTYGMEVPWAGPVKPEACDAE